MEKTQINNEIILGRKVVKKAKVHIIRKKIKTLKFMKAKIAANKVEVSEKEIAETQGLKTEIADNHAEGLKTENADNHVEGLKTENADNHVEGLKTENADKLVEGLKTEIADNHVKGLKKKKSPKKPLNDNRVEDIKRKVDKLVLEISEIKKISPDEVSKFALSNQKTPAEILEQAESNIKERVLAHFVENKVIKVWIEEMRAKFPNLDGLLCGVQKSKKKKKPKKQNKTKNVVKDDLSKSVEERFVNFLNNANEDSHNSENESDTACEASNRTMNNTTGAKSMKKKPMKKKKNTKTEVKGDLSHSVGGRFVKILNSANENSDNSDNESGEGLETSNTSMNKTTDTEYMTQIPLKSKKRKINTGDEQSKKPKTEKDSFFLTDKGEYESCIVKDEGSPEPKHNKAFGKNGNMKMKLFTKGSPQRKNNESRRIKPAGKNGNFKSKPFTKDQTHYEANFNKKISNGYRSNKNFKNELAQPIANKIEKIHPSWEAKKKEKKQQQSIHSFQGKKKKFDDH